MSAAPLVPLGAHLSPIDPPPPPPELDPREPAAPRRGRQTPQKARTPTGSRAASPSRPSNPRSTSSDALTPLHSPAPRTLSPPSGSHSPAPLIQPIPYPAAAAIGHHISRPNSPSNSVHSSSSAIFERDIEALPLSSLSLNPNPPTQTLSHKSSRLSHGSALEQTVPAVLDDAVEALQGTYTSRGIEGLEIEAPTAAAGVGMARQSSASLAGIGPRKASSASPVPISLSSRSGSPNSLGSGSPAQSPPILSQLSTHQSLSGASGGGVSPISPTGAGASGITGTSPPGGTPRPPMSGRTSTGPQVPGGWSSNWKHAEDGLGHQSSPLAIPPTGISPTEEIPAALTPPAAIPTHLSPSKDKRRISFISYNDLLLSVPTTVTNLGEITSGALSPEHLPGTVSPSMSTRSPVMPTGFSASPGPGAAASPISPEPGHPSLAGAHKPSWDAGSPGRGGLGFEGEWQREGLGKGLEQRLEDLVQHGQ